MNAITRGSQYVLICNWMVIAAGALFTFAIVGAAGIRSEAELFKTVIDLDSTGRFDESQALVLKFLNDEPGATANKILFNYLADLESHNQTERTIRVVTQVIDR